ncbi:MAG: molybdopterin-synthase adenylyltransferase MoeB [Alphaproteobacteria bacterium]|jgi:adenylyltransferase/sulfurtransferase|nr:molybdopterin-synthase adenylyltransferase MoeB [Alphaproteobacteria bacterium]
MALTDAQLERYARQVVLPEIDEAGQETLLAARVLVVGAGGLGSPLLLYLAAAGVGTLGIVDDDRVDLTNLQRQVIHSMADLGRPKVESAADRLRALNPDVTVAPHAVRLTADNAAELIAGYDLVADGSDNAETRFLVADTCHRAQTPLVTAALLGFDGQLTTVRGFEGGDKPCYRCIMGAPPPPEARPTCEEAGVLGALAGLLGSLQALEVIKELLGFGHGLAGRLLLLDALTYTYRIVRVSRDPACPFCH